MDCKSLSRDELVQLAKNAEKDKRFEDMAKIMKTVTENSCKDLKEIEEPGEQQEKDCLTAEERNLLSVAYKNVIDSKRSSWKMLSMIEDQENDSSSEKAQEACKNKKVIEDELGSICSEVLDLLEEHLIPNANASDSEIFYLTMKGDYYRYWAEYTDEDRKLENEINAEHAYVDAMEKAKANMRPTDPNRLGLALTLSVFYYEILNTPIKACHLAKQAFDDAIAELDNLDEASYKDISQIMQLLRDNLTLWQTDSQQEQDLDGYANN